jgi:hypothetical protein
LFVLIDLAVSGNMQIGSQWERLSKFSPEHSLPINLGKSICCRCARPQTR